jgi:hypothetical protein
MKRCTLLLAAIGLCMGGTTPEKFTGVVHDNRCVGPNCATQCPVKKGPVYTLQSGDEAWVLSDQKTLAPFVGRKVTITGKAGAGNKLKVVSIVPAR